MMTLILLGRVLFGGYFLYSGFGHFKNAKSMVGYAKMKGIPSPDISVMVTGLLLILGGAGIILNINIQLSIILVLVFLVPTTFIMHAFWKGGDANARMSEHINFMKNLALIGALLMMLGFYM